ncbi:hypothetical protein [Catenuloplanes japonicus]|uniref:hypothetical protein n=1 Tax=Catenuloplanes japonicus TaxID=33876 RepID=UPI000526059F|nr:hypothetical protein [Catenuloplanes japonicus]
MIAIELVTQATDALSSAWSIVAAEPEPIKTDNIVKFFASKIAPILLAVLGVIFIGRASKGEVSKVLTSSAIAIIGLGFIAGAGVLFVLGDALVKLMFTGE